MDTRDGMRTLAAILLVLALAETYVVLVPHNTLLPTEPTLAYRKAKADALFASAFKQFGKGGRVDLAQFRGKPLLVLCWAAWCDDCRAEAQALVALPQRTATGGLTVIAIGIDQADRLERFVRDSQIDYPVFVAGQDGVDLSKKLGNLLGELPYTAAIDRQGVFVTDRLGRTDPATLSTLATTAMQ